MKTNKLLSLIVFLLCFTLNLRAQSGTCGANLTWELTDSTLTISGSGAMDNSHPWSSYSSQIARVSLPEGLTNICDDAFDSASKLQSIVIPNTVTSIGKDAFYSCTSLKQITMSNAVETIGSYAFYKTAITSITLPSTLISLGTYAFNNCTQLAEITIPSSLSSIADYTFQKCTNLRKLVIEEGVKTIGAYTFEGCSKLNDITIPEGVISIGDQAFHACTSITDISLPTSILSIGNFAFQTCSSLASIVIPETITTIPSSAFSYCSSLKDVTLPNNLQTIGTYAFEKCAFTHIDIPNTVTHINSYAFTQCQNLTEVTIPDGVTTIGNYAFSSCSNLTSVAIHEGVTSIGYGAFCSCNLQSLSLPNSLQTIGNGSVSSYEDGAFENNVNLTEVTISSNLTKIGDVAFRGCTSLNRVTLPEGLTTIGKHAFRDCSKLQEITFPESLITIDAAAFYNCDLRELSFPKSLQTISDGISEGRSPFYDPYGVFGKNIHLTKVVFQGSSTAIGTYAFHGCSALSQVTLPKGITTINVATFLGCSSLSSIALPESLAVIEGAAFFGCGLESIVFPQSLQIIADGVSIIGATTGSYYGAFENNYKLTKITIPNKVTSIGSWAFDQCTSLSEVILPEGLTTIGGSAFRYCSSLKMIQLPKTVSSISTAFAYSGLVEIEIPENVTTLSGAFNGCSQLKNVILPPTIVSIGENTFKDCKSLPTIALPQSLTTIGKSAFEGCASLDNIVLPKQVKTIGSTAFKNCRILREITIPDNVTAISSSLFQGCTSLTTINLPSYLTSVGYCAFQDCNSLKEILLPEGITNIGYYAFENCYALHSLTIPSTVVTLEHYMFSGCTGLNTLNMLPTTPPTIDRTFSEAPSNLLINLLCGAKEAYMANANWAKLSYPINEISSNILTVKSNDNRMGEAYIPTPNTCDNDTAIIEALPREGYQFAHWHDGNTDNPRTITMDSDTTFTAIFEPLTTYQLTVNYDSKQGHIAGVGEYYPNEEATLTVTALGGYRFKQWGDGNTDNPRTIIMTQDTTLEALFIMGDYCGDDILYTFLNDTLALNGTGDMWNLSQYGWNMYADEVSALTLSNGITSIGTNAFMNLMFLPEVTIPASVKTIHKRAFENCRSLSSVTFAENSQLQTIDHWAFYECINLKALEIPEGVTTIGNGAFYGCAYLDSIVLPASMMSIADNGFAQCTKLSAMTVHAITPPAVDSKTFESVNRAIPVYVPFGTGATYRATPIWQEFNIQEMEAIDDPCANAIEVNWDMGLELSQLSAGWYKLYVGDIHANQADFTSTIINDLACPATITRAFYAHCEDEEPLFEGSATYELGKTIQTMSYADFADIVAPHVDYLYLNITDIVEDCQKDTIIENITDWVCDGGTYEDILGEEHVISSYVPDTHTWSNTIETDTTITIYNYTITPIVPPTIMTNELLATIHGATPVLIAGKKVDVTGTLEAIMNYYKMNDTEAVADVESVVWAAGANVTLACDAESHTMILKLTAGCDFELNVELLFEVAPIEVMTTTEAAIICEGETYQWQGISCSETGSYTYEIWNEEGCVVEIKVLELTVIPAEIVTTAETATICEGESYTWAVNGITYENLTTGVYSYKDTTMYDCTMEINTLQLTVEDCAPPCEDVDTEEYATICYGETFTWNGQSYSTTGEYTQTLFTTTGCDSIVTLYLTILPETIIVEESVTINEEYLPYTWRNQQCYSAGTYNESIPFANYPYCDSVIYVLNLTVEAPNKCGDNLYWHYSNNTMTITGYGAMYDDPELLSYRTQGWYPSRVTHVSLSNEITHIGNVAFADCANLTNIDIPTSVTSIGDGAFSWTGLQSITIPASVTELGEQVFEACNDLHTILYEGNPIAINNQTVHPLIGCVHLDTVITPAALWHCTAADPALEARYGVPHKAHYIEVTDGELTDQAVKYIAQNATTLEILDLTNATNTTLPYGAWSNCYQLTQLYLPEVIETLPESMIEGGCRLLELAIPATVTEIGNYAFAGCVNVWRMTVDAVIPPKVYENTFDGISRSISVQVPAGSEELYREAEYWREFFVETDAQQSPQKAQKILHEDQILILRNGKVYTTMGQLITNE
ncbi:MAG: leucine-rich repeat domain-containing protein [Paludibacteraceae bacterium]|nr:leucine-rich repeat domain-containing protein [Paludibacteraceae bacterium]